MCEIVDENQSGGFSGMTLDSAMMLEEDDMIDSFTI
jgi:hypothetical protein